MDHLQIVGRGDSRLPFVAQAVSRYLQVSQGIANFQVSPTFQLASISLDGGIARYRQLSGWHLYLWMEESRGIANFPVGIYISGWRNREVSPTFRLAFISLDGGIARYRQLSSWHLYLWMEESRGIANFSVGIYISGLRNREVSPTFRLAFISLDGGIARYRQLFSWHLYLWMEESRGIANFPVVIYISGWRNREVSPTFQLAFISLDGGIARYRQLSSCHLYLWMEESRGIANFPVVIYISGWRNRKVSPTFQLASNL